MSKEALEEKLNKLGLNKNEQKVYLEVLRAGKIAPSRVAKLTKINRTTVYSIAKKLAGAGLITEDVGGKVGYLLAEDVKNIVRILDREELALVEKKGVAVDLVHELSLIAMQKGYSVPRIKVVEEADLTEYLYKQYPSWAESGASQDNTWWGYHDSSFTETYGSWIDWCWEKGPANLQVNFLTNKAISEEEMGRKHPERNVRHWGGKPGFDTSLWVVGDYIIMVKSRERPHYMLEINDTVLARNLRELFRGIWEGA